MKPRVLVIQSDKALRARVCGYLEDARMQVLGVARYSETEASPPADGVELDVALCEAEALLEARSEGLAYLRGAAPAGVVALADDGRREDRIHALTLGVDHYLVSPLDLEELELIIRNLCHRHRTGGQSLPPVNGHAVNGTASGAAAKSWRFDRIAWALTAPTGRTMRVSQTEYQILARLIDAAGQVVQRQHILAALGDEYLQVYNRNLDMMISRLRRKVRDRCGVSLPVHSARGIGYVFTGAGEVVGGD